MVSHNNARRHSARQLMKMDRALNLYVAGARYPLIAQTVGCSEANARKLVTAALANRAEERAEQADLGLEMAMGRLEALWSAQFTKAARGDTAASLQCLRIHDRMVKLEGLDRPTQIDVHVTSDKLDADIAAMIDDFRAMPPVGATLDDALGTRAE